MQKRSIFQNRANKCFYGQNNPLLPIHPAPPPKENYFVRKFMVCLFIDRFNLGYGQCSLFLSRLLLSAWGCWKEDRRQHEKRDALLSLRPSQVLCFICLQQIFVKFPLQLKRYPVSMRNWNMAWFLCQLSFTIDSVKMFWNLRGTVIFYSLNKWNQFQ